MRKNLIYIATVVAVLLLSSMANSVEIANGVLHNCGEFKACQTGSFSAIIPDSIVGRTNSAQGNYYNGGWSGSGTFLHFSVKLDRNLFGWRLKEKYLNKNFLPVSYKRDKNSALFYSHAKRYFIYALREIII